ncbi:GrdX family protein [Clostridium fallax]|uniref:GrdX protein n=1 Tax=Clostridium fallax TaxID=1533 RepID=A0A1M4XGQ7_9CLOT|nr:GrdX family protein [Clostridium fallax]SHE92352.1 hypothetical protein SAMN05443638_11814 [Clostridium fallax]SQB06416.1 glycine reductase complex component [Clostridium fallax]
MNHTIITNNPLVKENMENVLYIEGSMKDVLIKTRDLIQFGSELITYPLGASLRMLFSPYRSIVIKEKQSKINPIHLEIIENSIIKYNQHMEVRKEDNKNKDDYKLIDFELLKSAFDEIKIT